MSDALVLLPDVLTDVRLWQHQVLAFAAERPVTVAPVHLGDRIEEVASALLSQLPSRMAVAGAGFGAMVALELMRRAPDRVLRIALCGATPLADTPSQAAAREERMIAARAGRLDDVIGEEITLAGLASDPARRLETRAEILAMGRALGAEAYVRCQKMLQRRRDQQAAIRRAKLPVLVLAGREDRLYPPARHEFTAGLIPYAELALIDGAGHWPMLDAPDAVTEALRGWLSRPIMLR